MHLLWNYASGSKSDPRAADLDVEAVMPEILLKLKLEKIPLHWVGLAADEEERASSLRPPLVAMWSLLASISAPSCVASGV